MSKHHIAEFKFSPHHRWPTAALEDWLRQNGCQDMRICTSPYESSEHLRQRVMEALARNKLELRILTGPPDQRITRLYPS